MLPDIDHRLLSLTGAFGILYTKYRQRLPAQPIR